MMTLSSRAKFSPQKSLLLWNLRHILWMRSFHRDLITHGGGHLCTSDLNDARKDFKSISPSLFESLSVIHTNFDRAVRARNKQYTESNNLHQPYPKLNEWHTQTNCYKHVYHKQHTFFQTDWPRHLYPECGWPEYTQSSRLSSSSPPNAPPPDSAPCPSSLPLLCLTTHCPLLLFVLKLMVGTPWYSDSSLFSPSLKRVILNLHCQSLESHTYQTRKRH